MSYWEVLLPQSPLHLTYTLRTTISLLDTIPADIQDKVIQVSHEAHQGVNAAQVISGGFAIIAAGAFLLYVGPAIVTAIPTIMEGLIAAMGIIMNTQPAM